MGEPINPLKPAVVKTYPLFRNTAWWYSSGTMFFRFTTRKKDGKEHRYWSLVENRRIAGGRVVQRQVLYLGEINDTQHEAWRKTIEVFEEGRPAHDGSLSRGSPCDGR